MRIYLFFFLILFVFATQAQNAPNQSDAQGRKQGFWIKKDPQGKVLYQGTFKDDKPVGEMKRFHSNGKVKAILVFAESSDISDATLFDERGQKIAHGKYSGQKKEGEWQFFTSGKLVSSETYTNDERNGLAKKYYQTGEVLEETNWKNNNQDGLQKAFYKNGKTFMESMYKDGQRSGWTISYYPNGEMETEAFYQDGKKHNDWKAYTDTGKLWYTLHYKNGILLNPVVLDSIQNLQVSEMEKGKGKVTDPEQFMQNPEEYMQKRNIPIR